MSSMAEWNQQGGGKKKENDKVLWFLHLCEKTMN
jgi:hypothetical protein